MAVDKRENGEKMELSQAPVLGSAYTHNFYGKCIMDIAREVYVRSGQAAVDLQIEGIALAHQHDLEKRERETAKRIKKDLTVDNSSPLLATCQALTPHERRNYSLSRAIRYAAQVAGGIKAEACLESDISHSIGDDLKSCARGLYVPLQLRPQAAGQDTKTNAAGGYLVGGELRDLITLLRAQVRLSALGARWITNLQKPTAFTIETTGSSASWVAENSGTDVSQVDLSFGLLTLRPRTLQATSVLSKQLVQQTSPSADRVIAEDLVRAHSQAIELAAVGGTGSANQPTGLLSTPNVNVIAAGANGAVLTYDHICQVEQATADNNADGTGWLASPALRKKLRVTYQNGSGSLPVWQDDVMLGKVALTSTACPSNLTKGAGSNLCALLYGAWNDLYIAQWSTLDIVVDPYSRKKEGLLELSSFALCDIGVARPKSFCVISDAALS